MTEVDRVVSALTDTERELIYKAMKCLCPQDVLRWREEVERAGLNVDDVLRKLSYAAALCNSTFGRRIADLFGITIQYGRSA